MDSCPQEISYIARRGSSRRAMSLLELVVVVAILGLLSVAAISTFGISTVTTSGAEGFARKLSLSLLHARRSTISTGDNHYLQLSSSGGGISSFTLYRRDSGGDVQMDQVWDVPQDVSVTASHTTLEFDFEGSALAGYSIDIAGPDRSWSVSVVSLTGSIQVVETTP